MKSIKFLSFIVSSMVFICAIQGQQNKEALWKEDVIFLKNTIHSKYQNLFYNISSKDFDIAVDDLMTKLPKLNEAEFHAEIGKIMAMFRIGHTQAGFLMANNQHGQNSPNEERLFPIVPVELYLFADGLFVKSAHEKYKKIVGAKITKIGNLTTEEALEKIKPYVNFENEQGFKSNVPTFLRFPKLLVIAGIDTQENILHLTYEKGNKVEEIAIPAVSNANFEFRMTGLETPQDWVEANMNSTKSLPLWRQEPTKFRNMVYLPESKICYIRHSVTRNEDDESLKNFFEKAFEFVEKHEVDKLVLDVRLNGGGNNQLNKPIITGIIEQKKINQPGKFFCIIGRRTFSACQNLVNNLQKFTEVTFIGEPTSENVNFYGDTKTEVLPNSKIQIFCSWLWWQDFFANDTRKAMSPNLAIDLKSSDFANNIDPVMDYIIENNASSSLASTIKSFEIAQDHEKALSAAKAYFSDPINRYFLDRIETEINDLGYELMNENKLSEAKNTFAINITLYPKSGNTYDSYAECCLKMGLSKEAKLFYQKAIDAEPNYANAEVAKQIIKQLE